MIANNILKSSRNKFIAASLGAINNNRSMSIDGVYMNINFFVKF
jgi:hypothetical protein